MISQINIINGFYQFQGVARHLKIISASSPLRIEVLAVGERAGRSLLSTQNVRAPMGFVLPPDAGTVNFYSADQTIEVWSGDQPLEYLQLTAVGASSMNATVKPVYAGVTEVLPANPRKSVKLLADSALLIGEDGAGWPLSAGAVQEFETIGAVNVYRERLPFDVNLFSDSQNVQTALAIANPHQTERFGGATYVLLQTGVVNKVTDAGVITNITGAIGTAKAGMLKAYGGALWVVGQIAGGFALFKSTDGNAWAVVRTILNGGVFIAVPYRTEFYRGIISATTSDSVYLVADLNTSQFEARPLRVTATTTKLASNGTLDFEMGNVGIYVRAASTPQAEFTLLKSGDYRNCALSENSGLPLGAQNNVFKVEQINLDGTSTQLSTTNVSVSETVSAYFNCGVDAWQSGTTLLFFVDGVQYSKTITASSVPFSGLTPDQTTNELYGLSSGASNLTLYKIAAGQELDIDPVKINILEFVI